MIISEAKYKTVTVKQRKIVKDEVYGCDECQTPIVDFPNESQRLELTVFYHNSESKYLHFCSWKCCLNHIQKIKTDYFISLPFVYCDEPKASKRGLNALLKELKKVGP